MSGSSTPPGAVRVVVPHAIIWAVLGNAVCALVAIAASWLSMHNQLLELQKDVGTLKALQDLRNDEFQRRLDQLDQAIGRAPRP